MNINILGIPLYYGSDRYGVQFGPEKLREAGIVGIFNNAGHKVFDLGNLYVDEVTVFDKFEANTNMKYLSAIVSANNNLAQSVYSTINAGNFPFTIGGDHALGLGTLAGASKAFGKDYGVIWIDAHGDINTDESSPSGNIHGMPLGASMGFGGEKLKNIFFKGTKVDSKNVYLICQRDLDKGEIELIKKYNINLWKSSDIEEKGIENIMKDITNTIDKSEVNNFHISFDIDSMDSSLVPGTGTPVKEGLNLDETKHMLKSLFDTGKIKAMDFAEYNPGLEYEITTKTCLDIINFLAEDCIKK
ncbi:MAG: arginase [Sarcina sp.]